MRLILHAGTHKTGTTSIQKALFDNRAWLRERGLIYPDGCGVYPKGRLAHHEFVRCFAKTSPESLTQAARFLDQVRDQLDSPSDTVLISAEPIYRHIAGYDDWQHFADPDYWDRRQCYLARLSEALVGFEIIVLLFFRERQSFARSLYAEVVCKKRHWQGSPREFMAHFTHWFEYERQVEAFKKVFPDVRELSYEKASEEGLIRTFFRTVGFPMPSTVDQIWERKTTLEWADHLTLSLLFPRRLRAFS